MLSKLNPKHQLFETLLRDEPIWWKNLGADKDLYVEVRKDNYLDVYHAGGRILELKYSHGLRGIIHFEYIPLKCDRQYVALNCANDSISISDNSLRVLPIHRFDSAELLPIKKRVRMFNPPSSEKAIQADFVLNNTQFLDTEFQYRNNMRFDMVWADISRRKLFVVELKTIGDQRLYIGHHRSADTSPYKIDLQLRKYRQFVAENSQELLSHYERLFVVKKKLGLLRGKLDGLDTLNGFTVEEKPILLIGDCTQNWIDQQYKRLNNAIMNVAYGCFYQGTSTRAFSIPERNTGNRYVFI
jgi:hypothetical protein